MKMSGESFYCNLQVSKSQKQCVGNKDNVSKDNNLPSADPTPPVGSKVVILEKGSVRVALMTLVCVCVVLLVLTITLGYLYFSNMTDLRAEKVHSEDLFAQMKGNLTATEDLLSSELQNSKRNLTEVNQLLANATAKQCAIGWVFYSGSCYYFSKDKLTWEQSQYACIHDGGHLVIIESQQEQDFIRIKVGNAGTPNCYWIGMTDSKVEGTWVWLDNAPLNNNTKYWDLNNGTKDSAYPEPNDWSPGEDCAQIGSRCSDQISCWLDYVCNSPSKRICESRSIK